MSMFASCYSGCRRTLRFTSSPTAVHSQARTHSALKTFVIASLVLLLLAPGQVSATIAPCNPGPTELLPHASVVTVAKPVSVEIKRENKRYHVLATYKVIESLRGEVGKEVIVESSCADATYTRPELLRGFGPIPGTYCKGGPKIAPHGFVRKGSTFVPESESSRVVLYLRPGKQGKATTFYDITRERRYYSCREQTYVADVCGEPQTQEIDPKEIHTPPYIDISCSEGFEELVKWLRENESKFPGPAQK